MKASTHLKRGKTFRKKNLNKARLKVFMGLVDKVLMDIRRKPFFPTTFPIYFHI